MMAAPQRALLPLLLVLAPQAPAAAAVAAASSSELHLRRSLAMAQASRIGEFLGENTAGMRFFSQWLQALPQNLTEVKQAAVVATLEAEVSKLSKNLDSMKELQNKERSHEHDEETLKKTMSDKDRAVLENMDKWSSRMNEKAKMGAMDVMSKLRNALHFVKKGALSGNGDANKRLTEVLKQMTSMTR